MDFVERIGPVLGIAAFVGLAVLIFLLFQQARDIRRLREWAGRAPERAQEAAAASLAAAEARGESVAGAEDRSGRLSWLTSARDRIGGALGPRWRDLDRRSPIPVHYVGGLLALGLVAALVLTGAFGLVGGDEDGGRSRGGGPRKPKVAVLNGTQTEGVQGVPQLASRVEENVVRAAHYPVGRVANAGASFPETTVMYRPGHENQAAVLARAVTAKLGPTPTAAMTEPIAALAGGAPLALVLGLNNAQFGGT